METGTLAVIIGAIAAVAALLVWLLNKYVTKTKV